MKNFIKLMGLMILSITSMQAAAVVAAPEDPFAALEAEAISILTSNNYEPEKLGELMAGNRPEEFEAQAKVALREVFAHPLNMLLNIAFELIQINNQGHRIMSKKVFYSFCVDGFRLIRNNLEEKSDQGLIQQNRFQDYREKHEQWMNHIEALKAAAGEDEVGIDFGPVADFDANAAA